ncbi:hypothetical protein CEXT_594081 [Caerostris extrusa]|uniref:Uncharacterized protein n=1 Tax=Caerostris extrusa TaxID=172846 RepID=A0AAV4SZ99_CAEEX|nr:hypothetical protein CEXT_594081 [Caerostris extrusa]
MIRDAWRSNIFMFPHMESKDEGSPGVIDYKNTDRSQNVINSVYLVKEYCTLETMKEGGIVVEWVEGKKKKRIGQIYLLTSRLAVVYL